MENPIVTGFKQGRDFFVSELRVHGEEVQNCCRNFALIVLRELGCSSFWFHYSCIVALP